MEGNRDWVVVYYIAIALAGERQCAEVEGMGVDLGSMAEADTEAAVAAVQGHYFVSDLDDIHSYWKEDSRSIVRDLQAKAFAPLRTIFAMPWRIEKPWFAFVRQVAGKPGRSSSEIFLAAEKLQIYLRKRYLFGRRTHGHGCSDGYCYPAGLHNLPCLAAYS